MIAHCIYLVKLLEDFELVYVFFKIYGLTLQLNNRVSKSLHVFEILRDLAYEIKDPVYIMESYRYLGLAHQYARQYIYSVICFKMILMFAWFHTKRDWELIAFNHLAIEYFYLGEM